VKRIDIVSDGDVMLTASFCCFKGISKQAEERLWHAGVLGWREILLLGTSVLSERKLNSLCLQIREAMVALESGAIDYFVNRLNPPDTIRALPHFLSRLAYIDIETTGLSKRDYITSIAVYYKGEVKCFIRGRNLSEFIREIQGIDLLLTYNGKRFDLPRIRKEFKIDLAMPNIDLRDCLVAMGYRGGLKQSERLLGIKRQVEAGLSGLDAVELWNRYLKGDKYALNKLVRYNLQDVLVLEQIAIELYNQVMSVHPESPRLRQVRQPDLVELDVLEGL